MPSPPMNSDRPSTVDEEKFDLPSPMAEEKTDLPPEKRQKLEEDKRVSYYNDDVTEEELQRWYDEWEKSKGYEIDFSKVTYCASWKPVDLDETAYQGGRGTNRDFLARLANMALDEHNEEYNTNLELGKILRANYHLSTGLAYYISFEVTDPSDGNQTKPYRAMVRYLNEKDIEVHDFHPKPSS